MHHALSKSFLLIALLLELITKSALAQGPQFTQFKALVPPREAPPLVLKNLANQPISLADLRTKKVVLVNFFATWCPPCRQEMPSIQRLWSQLKGPQFEVLAIDAGEDSKAAAEFTSSMEIPLEFPILVDPDSKAMQAWKIIGLPTSYLIDKQGQIIYSAVGGRKMNTPEIVAAIKKLMQAK